MNKEMNPTPDSQSYAQQASAKKCLVEKKAEHLKQEQIKKQRLKELVTSTHQIIQKIQNENSTHHFANLAYQEKTDELKNELLSIQRTLSLDKKTMRLSEKTIQWGNTFLAQAEKTVDDKKLLDRFKTLLDQIHSSEQPQTNQQKIEQLQSGLAKAENSCTDSVNKTLVLFRNYMRERQVEIGEERALCHSLNYYLQFVDATQRAHIETTLNEKMKTLSFPKRIVGMRSFIETLVNTSDEIKEVEAGRAVAMAQHFIKQNHLDKAITELQHSLQFKQETATYELLTLCYERKDDLVNVIRYLHMAVQCSPDHLHLILKLAHSYEKAGKSSHALQTYQQALKHNSGSLPILKPLADLAYQVKDWELCIQHYTTILEQQPDSLIALQRLGTAHIHIGHHAQGIQVLKEATRIDPNSSEILLTLAEAFHAEGYLSDALSAVQQAKHLAPESPEVSLKLASITYDQGNYEKTESLCQTLLDENLQTEEATFLLAKAKRKLGLGDEAYRLLEPLIQQRVPSQEILLEYSRAFLDADDSEKAYQTLHAQLDQFENDQEFRYVYGLTCIQSGRMEESIPYITPA